MTETFDLKEIQVLDNDILVNIPRPAATKVILSPEVAGKVRAKERYEVLQVGSMVNVGEGITPIEVGDILYLDLRGMPMEGFTLNDFDYPTNATIVYRNNVVFKLLKQK